MSFHFAGTNDFHRTTEDERSTSYYCFVALCLSLPSSKALESFSKDDGKGNHDTRKQ